jgi:hypothetical protein
MIDFKRNQGQEYLNVSFDSRLYLRTIIAT